MHAAPLSILFFAAPISNEATQGYAEILQTYVQRGRVDYIGLKKNDLPKLDQFLDHISKADLPSEREKKIGFLIDAYNALVLRAVIEHGRPRSVLDVKGFFHEKTYVVGGKAVTLDALEKKVLNPFAKDPRTHFVLVCAAVGCPPLQNKPYYGSKVQLRMEQASKAYLESPWGARIEGASVRVSKIFDWYKADFGGEDGVKQFLSKRLKLPDPFTLGYLDYNWTLNQQ